jgi:hypothetical protein
LSLDNCKTRLLPRCWFYLLPIDDNTGKTSAWSILRVLCVLATSIGRRVKDDPRAARAFTGPLSAIRTTPWDAWLIRAIFALDFFKNAEHRIVLAPDAHVASPIGAKEAMCIRSNEPFLLVLQ